MMLKKTGLFFGTYNPVHVGHMVIANYMLEYSGMDELWMVVSPENPLKKKSTMLADHHRFELVSRAIGDHPGIKASRIEFQLPKPSYTIDTLVHLKEKYPDRQFGLIMGSDNLETLHKWKNHEVILENYDLYVYPRPGYAGGSLIHHDRVSIVKAPQMDISATFIRKAIEQGRDVRYFVPEGVWSYIREMHFFEG